MDREGQMETNKPAEEVTKEEKTKEDLEEETFAAINGYLTASANEERYPSTYSKDQKRELRRKAKRYSVDKGKLMYHTRKGTWVEAIFGKSQRVQILKACHSDGTAGHLGRTKTFYKVSQRYYWPGIFNDVEQFVRVCEVCQHTNTRTFDKTKPELHPIKVQSPWHHIGIDLVGPLPITARNNRYILTLSDYCTKWVDAVPLESKCATGIALALFKIFMRMGIPRVLSSDQGREFNNAMNKELAGLLGIRHRLTTAYHPQANGLDERFNQTIQSMLVKFCQDKKDAWDEHLDSCTFGYNTSQHDSTKFSPFELMFGRKAVLPVELDTQKESPEDVLEEFNNAPSADSNASFLQKLMDTRSAIIGKAKENITKAQEKQRKHYNRKHASPAVYQVGATVLVKDFLRHKRKEGKIDYRWLGPYVILKNLGKGIYLLQEPSTLMERRVNGAHMKHFYESPTSPPPSEIGDDDTSVHNATVTNSTYGSQSSSTINSLGSDAASNKDDDESSQPPPKKPKAMGTDSEVPSSKGDDGSQPLPMKCKAMIGSTTSQSPSYETAEVMEQLFSDTLLRLWRFGADTLYYGTDEFRDFSNCFKSPDEHALNINPDVALWLDSRSYDSKPQLREASGFVIVNPMLHSEFEAFKAAVSTPECNNLRLGPLLQYWKDFVRPSCGDVLTMFGSHYLRLHYSEVDDLCQWVLDSREACQKGATLEDLIKGDVTSKNANKEHGSKDIPAVIDITDQDQAKVSILSSTSPKKNTRNGGRGRGEEHHWVTISGLRLTETDKHILLEGQWLNDKHIHASQLLMKNDSSLLPVGSLQSPLLGQTLHFDVTSEESVQILHTGNHWLTISTVGTRHPSVRVYDSLHQTLPHSIKMQVAALLNTKEEEIVVHHANVQQQKNFSDCGLFAIAFAMSICNEQCPEELCYDTTVMRRHLFDCFEHQKMQPFPSKPRRCFKKTLRQITFRVFCHCRLPEQKPMIACDQCHQWFHKGCEAVPEAAWTSAHYNWSCSSCSN